MDRPDNFLSGDVVQAADLAALALRDLRDRHDMRIVEVAAITARGYDESHKATGLPSLALRQDTVAEMPAMTITAQAMARVECSFTAHERGAQIP